MLLMTISLHYKVKEKPQRTKEPSLGTPQRVLASDRRHLDISRATLVLATLLQNSVFLQRKHQFH